MKKITLYIALSTLSINSYALEHPVVSGSLDIVSQYISKGLTNAPENEKVTLQAALNANWDQFSVFYWGSTLGYSFKEIQTGQAYTPGEFEHDVGLNYQFQFGDVTVDLWDAFYYYQGGKKTTSNELGIVLTKPLSNQAKISAEVATFLYDVAYMNQWDTYLSLSYYYQFNDKLSATFNTGFSYFNDDGKYEGGDFLNTQKDFTFRVASVQANYLIQPDVTGYGQFIVGGDDRANVKQANRVVFGLNYTF